MTNELIKPVGFSGKRYTKEVEEGTHNDTVCMCIRLEFPVM